MKKVLFLIFLTINYCAFSNNGNLRAADPQAIQKIYQMLKDIHELLTIHQIDYWLESGTLLGAVRHRGLIPWDDDLDIGMDKKDELRLIALQSELEQLGYGIVGMPFGYKIYPFDGTPIEKRPWKYPYLDIFLMKQDQEKFLYVFHWNTVQRDGEAVYLKVNEMYPLKEYLFGPLIVKGPNNPLPLLNSWYGDDWNEIAYMTYDHSRECSIESIPVSLTREQRNPALPYEQLKNRVAKPSIKMWLEDFQEMQQYSKIK